MIFSPLSIPDLLNCSVVNKNWRVAVRPVLHKQKKCFADVKDPWVDLAKLNDMMGKTNVEMVNGLHIRIDRRKIFSAGLRKEKLLDNLSHLLSWPFQYLHAEGYYRCNNTVCGAMMQVIQELLWASKETMKEIAFEFCDISYSNFFNFQEPLGKRGMREDGLIKEKVYLFPKLKSIEFLNRTRLSGSCSYTFVLEAAPNLMEIKGKPVSLGSVNFWNERAMRLLKSVYLEQYGSELEGEDDLDNETLWKFVRSGAQLQFLNVFDNIDDESAPFPSSWFDPLAHILRNSRYTLNKLYFCASELMKFLRLEGFSDSTDKFMYFTNVKTLQLSMPQVDDPIVERSILRRLSIGANFPKLQQLEVDFGGCSHELEGEEYEWDFEDCPPSNLRIALHTDTHWCDKESLEYFVNTFPLLTSLHVGTFTFFYDDEHAYSFSDVFSSFIHLKQLHLELNYRYNNLPNFSLDAIFCGINFEEVDRLRSDFKKNGMEPGRMEIVPVRPGITSALSKYLRHCRRHLVIMQIP